MVLLWLEMSIKYYNVVAIGIDDKLGWWQWLIVQVTVAL